MKTIRTLLTIILTFTGTVNTFACSCQDELPVSASVKRADVVFSGQVISKTLTHNLDSLGIVVTGDTSKTGFNWRELPVTVVKIKVEKMYKGKLVASTLTILTPATGAMFKPDLPTVDLAKTSKDSGKSTNLIQSNFVV